MIQQGASIDSQSRLWVGQNTKLLKYMQKAASEYQVQKHYEGLRRKWLKNSLSMFFIVAIVSLLGDWLIQLFPQNQAISNIHDKGT